MSEDKLKNKKYKVALTTRNFEIELFWKRSIFFWGFIASAFLGYAALVKDNPNLAVVLACFGFVCSVAWSLVNRGSKYWQENWESKVAEIENDVTGNLFKERSAQQDKGIWLSSRKFSVSKVTIALSDFTCLIWFSLMLYHVFKVLLVSLYFSSEIFVPLAVFASVVFAFFMAAIGRSSHDD